MRKRGAPSPAVTDSDSDGPDTLCSTTGPRLSAVIGLSDAKTALREALLLPRLFARGTFTGLRDLPRAILLHGAPGTGKTMLVRAAATEAGAPCFCVAPSHILSRWYGGSEKALRRIFTRAAAAAATGTGAVLFLDELDALAPSRGSGGGAGGGLAGGGDGASRRLLNELLLLLTEHVAPAPIFGGTPTSLGSFIVVGATNRAEDIDPAILRRFVRRIECTLPTPSERAALTLAFLADTSTALREGDVAWLAGAPTHGWSGADLRAMLSFAAMVAVREALDFASSREWWSACVPAQVVTPPLRRSAESHAPPPHPAALVVRPLVRTDIEEALRVVRPAFECGASTLVPTAVKQQSQTAPSLMTPRAASIDTAFEGAVSAFTESVLPPLSPVTEEPEFIKTVGSFVDPLEATQWLERAAASGDTAAVKLAREVFAGLQSDTSGE